jgi:hypothetical protein
MLVAGSGSSLRPEDPAPDLPHAGHGPQGDAHAFCERLAAALVAGFEDGGGAGREVAAGAVRATWGLLAAGGGASESFIVP